MSRANDDAEPRKALAPLLHIGQIVAVADSQHTIGVIVAVGSESTYSVFHNETTTVEYRRSQLSPATGKAAPPVRFRPELAVGPSEFLARITATRLASPLTDSIYSLHAARIRFIPFQFKPLLRFLRADRPRLLIADEVGVGKTIEAGLILRELQARQKVQNVIIVCPKALVSKWRAEMRRFDEDFAVLGPEALRYCLREAHLEGAWPAQYNRAIVHLELLRNPEYLLGSSGRHPRPGLQTLNPAPAFSLAIFDEAHHVRNPTSNSHAVARVICDNADAALFLSATPVQLGSNNLYVLLNLLRPDLFGNAQAFQAMSEPTRHVNGAMREVRLGSKQENWQRRALNELQQAAGSTSWGRYTLASDERFRSCVEALEAEEAPTEQERIRVLRSLEDIHPFAHVINRTRRRDVGRFTVREPHTIAVPFTPQQSEFYGELIGFRSQWLAAKHEPGVVNLILDMLERQVASCLPALLPMLDTFLDTGSFSPRRASDEDEDDAEIPEELLDAAESLRESAAALPVDDPKADALLSIVIDGEAANRVDKTLVFSYFLHTLYYLLGKLEDAGVRVALICGQTPDEAWDSGTGSAPTRSQLRERFRLSASDPDAIDVLLSSEVGCEGLDYEFCDRLVNYDIPWNPMRLEQRIGRIDRFGQISPKVRIFNFITPGTVEERIFFRCYERMGIFRDTVGDCEDVLGELELRERLVAIAHNSQLSPAQAEQAASQVADNVLRLAEERARLDRDAQGLFGLDHELLGETQQLASTDRCVSPAALRQMVSWYLGHSDTQGQLRSDKRNGNLLRLDLGARARVRLLAKVPAPTSAQGAAREFARWLEGDAPPLVVTFDPATALERRDVAFVTPVHPLARAAVAALGETSEVMMTRFAFNGHGLHAGSHLVSFELWDTSGVAPQSRLRVDAWNVPAEAPCPALAGKILSILEDDPDRGQLMAANGPVDLATIGRAATLLDEHVDTVWHAEVSAGRASNARMLARRLAGVDAWYGARLGRLDAEIASTSDSRIRRMKASQRARIDEERLQARDVVQRHDTVDISRRRVAFAVVEVVNAD